LFGLLFHLFLSKELCPFLIVVLVLIVRGMRVRLDKEAQRGLLPSLGAAYGQVEKPGSQQDPGESIGEKCLVPDARVSNNVFHLFPQY
jgi:hypothetical protein